MSFYNYDQENNILNEGSFISIEGLDLVEIDKDTYQYPVQGWYWFDTLEEATAFFNISEET